MSDSLAVSGSWIQSDLMADVGGCIDRLVDASDAMRSPKLHSDIAKTHESL